MLRQKSDGTLKIWWVVVGCQQKKHLFEDSRATVVRGQTTRLMLALALRQELDVDQIDVKVAFLNGIAKGEIYVEQPHGFEQGENLVCRLHKSLYGLRGSPKAWQDVLSQELLDQDFKRSFHDECLYLKTMEDGTLLALTAYVDDIKIYGKRKHVDSFKTNFSKVFEIRDLGPANKCLGMNMSRSTDHFTVVNRSFHS